MNKFRVDLEYFIPELGDITVDAPSAEAAETLALKEFEANFPEAVDVTTVMVTKL